jgi:hypothetical protein
MESKKEKYRQKLNELVESGRFIPGIYNYCDRWCERCTLSHRCLNYAHEQEMMESKDDPEQNDIKNKKFWEQIRLSFEVAMEMIYEDAERLGIDLDNLPDVEEPEHVESPVEKLAEEYGYGMHDWLKENDGKLKGKAEQLLMIHNDEKTAVRFADAWEVVQWYSFFISAKVHRAHFDLEERLNEEEDEFDMMSDNLGSAKIALIAIDRSMEGLSVLYPEMKDQEDEILPFLAQLSQIKKQMLATFPTALDFKRPGFDD